MFDYLKSKVAVFSQMKHISQEKVVLYFTILLSSENNSFHILVSRVR
jgi:hypothetical protein